MPHSVSERWQERLKQYSQSLSAIPNHESEILNARQFRSAQSVRLQFPDGSSAFFRFAFCLTDEALREAAVFTEHCGYHFFPLGGLTIETLREVYEDNKADVTEE